MRNCDLTFVAKTSEKTSFFCLTSDLFLSLSPSLPLFPPLFSSPLFLSLLFTFHYRVYFLLQSIYSPYLFFSKNKYRWYKEWKERKVRFAWRKPCTRYRHEYTYAASVQNAKSFRNAMHRGLHGHVEWTCTIRHCIKIQLYKNKNTLSSMTTSIIQYSHYKSK